MASMQMNGNLVYWLHLHHIFAHSLLRTGRKASTSSDKVFCLESDILTRVKIRLLVPIYQLSTRAARASLESSDFIMGEEGIGTALGQRPGLESGSRVEALELAVGGEEAGVVEVVEKNVSRVAEIKTEPGIGVVSGQVHVAGRLVLLDDTVGGGILEGEAAVLLGDVLCGGWDGSSQSQRDEERREDDELHCCEWGVGSMV